MQPQKKTIRHLSRLFWLWVVLGVLLLIAALFAFVRPATAPGGAALPEEISVAQAAAELQQGAWILDVREQQEWETVHIPDATLIPLAQLPSRLSEVPKDQEVIVVCRSGNRSAQARDLLKQAGYSNVTSMAGGMNEWQAHGFPTVSGP